MHNNNTPSLYNSLQDSPFKDLTIYMSNSIQVGPNMALTNLLSGVSSAVNGKFEVVGKNGWTEPLNNYFILLGDSGERKSAIVKIAKAPHNDWVFKKNKQFKKALQKTKRENKRIKAKIRALERKAEKAEEPECDLIYGEIEVLENKIQILKEIRIFFGDITAPALIRVLSLYDGRICHFEPEAGLLDILCKKSCNISLFCNAYDGESCSIDRVKEEPLNIPRPSISLSITVQPGLGMKFLKNKRLHDIGLLGRCLYVWSSPMAGHRLTDTPPIPEESLQWYNNKITSLLDIPDQYDEFGNVKPRKLELSYEASICLNPYKESVEKALQPGGALSFSKSWGSKLIGKVLRLAGLLHCIKHEDPSLSAIDRETMMQAISLGEGFIVHAQKVYYYASQGKKIEAGKKILNWANSQLYMNNFTAKEAYDNADL
ncbi:MAG: DUF3987 domain-containing protein [Desulfobacterium sp.]|nr:DUF3987 domain-containing protein [Desulfobacterium sp.]